VECEWGYRCEARVPGSTKGSRLGVVPVFAALCALIGIFGAGPAQARTHAGAGPWSSYVAGESTCPGGDVFAAPAAAQAKVMTCLVNYARAARGLRKLRLSPKLSNAARLKAQQIERCGVFDHAPCGGSPTAVADRVGYKGSFGENLYMGQTTLGTARQALREWLASRPHRENMFDKDWRVQALSVVHVDELDGFVDANVWVLQFGDV
jgi:uncharacterized protein YkwD